MRGLPPRNGIPMPDRKPTLPRCALILVILFVAATVRADQSPALHEKIDAAIAKAHVGPFAQLADDYEFLRRLYLNLIGRTPTAAELREFAADSDSAKRARVIDNLIASSEFDRHFVHVLDIMWMERRSGNRVDQQQWLDFLGRAVAEKWSFDQIVQRIITADGSGDQRGAAKFLLARDVEPNALTRDIGRIFFGRDLQCAQCHDHPNIMDYEQAEYYGIYAFVNRSYLFEDAADNKKAYVGEKAEGETEFVSVFLPDDGTQTTIPTLLNGLTLDVEPKLIDAAYVVAPSKTQAGVPRFSRRAQLARLITQPQNVYFAQNAVNRFWAIMFGQGLVYPVDFHHSDNPPSHPALLKLLADEFVAMEFDYRELLRQIALSNAFQRTIDFPAFGSSPVDTQQRDTLDRQVQAWQDELAQSSRDSDEADIYRARLELRRETLAHLDERIEATVAKRISQVEEQTQLTKKLSTAKEKWKSAEAQRKALQDAEQATRKASEALPDDAAISSAVKSLEARVASLTKSAENSKQAVEKHQQKLNELTSQLDEVNRQLLTLQSERIGVADLVAEARGAVGVFLSRQRRADARREELKQRVASAEQLREFLDRTAQSSTAKRQADELGRQLESAQQEVTSVREEVSALQNRLADVRQSIESNSHVVPELQATHDRQKQLAEGFELVVANLTASKHLAGQADVALAVVEQRQSEQRDEVAELEAKLARAREQDKNRRAEIDRIEVRRSDLIARLKLVEEQLVQRTNAHQLAIDESAQASAQLTAAETAIRDQWQQRNAVRSLTPLSPEQLAGATITALGLDKRYRHDAAREWKKNQKTQADKQNGADGTKKDKETAVDQPAVDETAKAREIESLYKKRVDNVVKTYVSMFAAPGGAPQDVFSATADQALFLSNDGRVQNWLAPAEGTLLKRLQSVKDPEMLADELYLAVLSRPATAEEQQQLTQYLAERTQDRSKALQEVAWGLLSSLEFRFNH